MEYLAHIVCLPGYYRWVYIFLINAFEVRRLASLTVCVIFLRRDILKLKRFISKDLWWLPRSDANYILTTEILLMSLFLTMNAITLLQQRGYGHLADMWFDFHFFVIDAPSDCGMSNGSLEALERTCWWLHITGIFAFLNYLPYSKHFAYSAGVSNAYYAPL